MQLVLGHVERNGPARWRCSTEEFDFDVLLGGINVDSTQLVNEFGRARLADVWRRVTEVTGTTFGPGSAGRRFRLQQHARLRRRGGRARADRPCRRSNICADCSDRFFLGAEDITNPALLIA